MKLITFWAVVGLHPAPGRPSLDPPLHWTNREAFLWCFSLSLDVNGPLNVILKNNKRNKIFILYSKQECIPVGCVPPAAVAVSPGGGGVCFWSRGVSASGRGEGVSASDLGRGVCLWSRGCLLLVRGEGVSASSLEGWLPVARVRGVSERLRPRHLASF